MSSGRLAPIVTSVRRLGRFDPRARLRELGRRGQSLVLAGALGSVGAGFLALAAYRGLARVMAPELGAALIGIVLLAGAALAYARARARAPHHAPADPPPAPSVEPSAEQAAALATLLRQAGLGDADLSVASLVAGFALGSRRRRPRAPGPGSDDEPGG
jgi:hypothetical protein